MSNKCSQSE